MNTVLWTPSESFAQSTNLTRFRQYVRDRFGGPADDSYAALHCWSLDHRGDFWSAVWQFAHVIGERGDAAYVPAAHMTEAKWFPVDKLPPREECAHHGWAHDIVAKLTA